MCICSYVLLYSEIPGGRVVFSMCAGLLVFGLYTTSGFVLVSGLVHVPFDMSRLVFLVCVHGGGGSVFGLRCRLCGFSLSVCGCA